MQVICTDGTVPQCPRFEAIDSGVLLFDEQEGRQEREASEDEEEAEEEREEAFAFVPTHQLRFVLPDGLQPGRPAGQPSGQTTSRTPTQAPPTGVGMPPRGQMSSQQSSMGKQPPRSGGQSRGSDDRQGRR